MRTVGFIVTRSMSVDPEPDIDIIDVVSLREICDRLDESVEDEPRPSETEEWELLEAWGY